MSIFASPPVEPWITTSWDDGHPLDFRLAELLARYDLPATFYIPRRAPGGTMSEAQIRDLAARFEIGAHTLDHVFLTEADDVTARREIFDSKAWVEDVTGKPCRMFCPPAGKFAARHVAWVRDAGFTGMRTVELLSLDRPRRESGLWVMPTSIHAFPHRTKAYIKNAARRAAWGNLIRYVRLGRGVAWERLAERVLHETAERGGVFHLWGHSWEIEQTGQWDAVGRVLKILGEAGGSFRRVANGDTCDASGTAAGTAGPTRNHHPGRRPTARAGRAA